jgi:hypothetical protein
MLKLAAAHGHVESEFLAIPITIVRRSEYGGYGHAETAIFA